MKTMTMMESDRPSALREAIMCCGPGGTVSVAGVYGGFVDKFPMGAFMNKGLTMKTGQTHVHRYMRPLLDRVLSGQIDPTFVISHRIDLADAPDAYAMFQSKQDDCTKVVMRP